MNKEQEGAIDRVLAAWRGEAEHRARVALEMIGGNPERDIECQWWRKGLESAATMRHIPTGHIVGRRGPCGYEPLMLAQLLEEVAERVTRSTSHRS